MDGGQYLPRVDTEGILIRDLVDRYRRDIPLDKRGSHFRPALRLLEDRFGKYSVAAPSPRRIADFRDQRLRSGHATSTVEKEINLPSRIFDLTCTSGASRCLPILARQCRTHQNVTHAPVGCDRKKSITC